MISKTLILSLASFVSAQPIFDAGDVYNNTQFTVDEAGVPYANCAAVKDCFDCVLLGCQFKGGACVGDIQAKPKISDFFLNSKSCPDTQQVCAKKNQPKDGNKHLFDEIVYNYDERIVGKEVPHGYFCV